VLSVSVDSHFVHKMWQDNELSKMVKGDVPFPMLSDQTGKIGTVFGTCDDSAGVEMRGKQGKAPRKYLMIPSQDASFH
jgi:alkyl hydroperoxide reductase subunit AhpC